MSTNSLQYSHLSLTSSSDLSSIQKRRRMRRVEIMKRKREMARLGSRQQVFHPTPSLEGITDPLLLRKLKNRESAARSRQRKDDMIDELTVRLCEYYVSFMDLQSQHDQLLSMLRDYGASFSYTEALPFPLPSVIDAHEDDHRSISDVSSCDSSVSSRPPSPTPFYCEHIHWDNLFDF